MHLQMREMVAMVMATTGAYAPTLGNIYMSIRVYICMRVCMFVS
jgi:hypothetical protein